MPVILPLLVILVALAVADCVTTIRGLREGAEEANPVARWAFEKIGVVPTMVLLKGGLTVGFAAFFLHYPQFWYLLGLLLIGSAAVVYHNMRVLSED